MAVVTGCMSGISLLKSLPVQVLCGVNGAVRQEGAQ